MATIGSMIGKVLLGMLMKMITEKPLEELVLFALDKLSKSTESKVDDELVAIVKKAINGEK